MSARWSGVLVVVAMAATLFLSCAEEEGGREGAGDLSQEQQLVQASLGPPTFFILDMAPDDSEVPPRPNRHHMWFYPEFGVSFTFVDGVFVGGDDIGSMPAGAQLPSWTPDQFRQGMSVEELQEVVKEEPARTLALPDAVLPDAVFYEFTGMYAGFQGGALVYVETSPFVIVEASASTRLDGEPLVFAGEGLRHVLVISDAQPEPVSLAPSFSPGIVGWGKASWKWVSRLWKAKKAAGTGVDVLDLAEIDKEIKGAAAYLREQSASLREEARGFEGSDPVKAAQLREAANQASEAADALEEQLLPALRGEKIEAGKTLIPVIGDIYELMGGGPDPDKLRKLLDQFTQDMTGRQGKLPDALRQWLDELAGDWEQVPPKVRESVVAQLLAAEVKKQCGARSRSDEYQECQVSAINGLRAQLRDWPTGYQDCLNELDRLRKSLRDAAFSSSYVMARSQGMQAARGVFRSQGDTCPARAGREAEPPASLTEPAPTTELAPTATPEEAAVLSLHGTFNLGWEDVSCSGPYAVTASGAMDLSVDFEAGTATASLSGQGSGAYSESCDGAVYEGTWNLSASGTLNGSVNPADGALALTGQLTVGANIHFQTCTLDGEIVTCFPDLGGTASFPASISGTVDANSGTGQGSITGLREGQAVVGDWTVGG